MVAEITSIVKDATTAKCLMPFTHNAEVGRFIIIQLLKTYVELAVLKVVEILVLIIVHLEPGMCVVIKLMFHHGMVVQKPMALPTPTIGAAICD